SKREVARVAFTFTSPRNRREGPLGKSPPNLKRRGLSSSASRTWGAVPISPTQTKFATSAPCRPRQKNPPPRLSKSCRQPVWQKLGRATLLQAHEIASDLQILPRTS